MPYYDFYDFDLILRRFQLLNDGRDVDVLVAVDYLYSYEEETISARIKYNETIESYNLVVNLAR